MIPEDDHSYSPIATATAASSLAKRRHERRTLKYDDHHCPDIAYRAALAGYDNVRIAQILGVRPECISNWIKNHPRFAQALHEGRELSSLDVGASLFKKTQRNDMVGAITGIYWSKARMGWSDQPATSESSQLPVIINIAIGQGKPQILSSPVFDSPDNAIIEQPDYVKLPLSEENQ